VQVQFPHLWIYTLTTEPNHSDAVATKEFAVLEFVSEGHR